MSNNKDRSITVGPTVITVVLHGNVYQVSRSAVQANVILEALVNEESDARLFALLDSLTAVATYSKGNIKIKGEQLTYKGDILHNEIATRIVGFLRDGLPFDPLANFLEKLMLNPSKNSRDQLYEFLKHKHLPITPDGDLLAYKGVALDYYSLTSGSLVPLVGKTRGTHPSLAIYNGVGESIVVDRSKVDDNLNNHCSVGLHVGSYEYARDFGAHGKLVVVKVNPAHVVSVPSDCNCQKMRVSAYTVVADCDGAIESKLQTGTEDALKNRSRELDQQIQNSERAIRSAEARLADLIEEQRRKARELQMKEAAARAAEEAAAEAKRRAAASNRYTAKAVTQGGVEYDKRTRATCEELKDFVVSYVRAGFSVRVYDNVDKAAVGLSYFI